MSFVSPPSSPAAVLMMAAVMSSLAIHCAESLEVKHFFVLNDTQSSERINGAWLSYTNSQQPWSGRVDCPGGTPTAGQLAALVAPGLTPISASGSTHTEALTLKFADDFNLVDTDEIDAIEVSFRASVTTNANVYNLLVSLNGYRTDVTTYNFYPPLGSSTPTTETRSFPPSASSSPPLWGAPTGDSSWQSVRSWLFPAGPGTPMATVKLAFRMDVGAPSSAAFPLTVDVVSVKVTYSPRQVAAFFCDPSNQAAGPNATQKGANSILGQCLFAADLGAYTFPTCTNGKYTVKVYSANDCSSASLVYNVTDVDSCTCAGDFSLNCLGTTPCPGTATTGVATTNVATTGVATTNVASTAPATTGAASSPESISDTSSDGLGLAIVAVIVVGAILVCIGVCALLFGCFVWRKRKNANARSASSSSSSRSSSRSSDAEGGEASGAHYGGLTSIRGDSNMSTPSNGAEGGGGDDSGESPETYGAVPRSALLHGTDYMSLPVGTESGTPDPAGKKGKKKKPKSDNRWEIDPDALGWGPILGRGAYGIVYDGMWRRTRVAIKVMTDMSAESLADFHKEAAVMQQLRPHGNVVQLLGVCPTPYSLVTEFMAFGSLDSWLPKHPRASPKTLAKISTGVARGVLHLHCEGIIHRDLAARNVLLSDGFVAKVGDFGQARNDQKEERNQTKTDTGPLKWMAPEAITDLEYSTKTDAWSYGVTLVEIFNHGEEPYKGEPGLRVATRVAAGLKSPDIPTNAPERVQEVMKKVFVFKGKERPDFEAILTILESADSDDDESTEESDDSETDSKQRTKKDSKQRTATLRQRMEKYSKATQGSGEAPRKSQQPASLGALLASDGIALDDVSSSSSSDSSSGGDDSSDGEDSSSEDDSSGNELNRLPTL